MNLYQILSWHNCQYSAFISNSFTFKSQNLLDLQTEKDLQLKTLSDDT